MTPWHRTTGADVALRLGGALGCAIAYAVFARLITGRPPATDRSIHLLQLTLAAIGFVAASAGSALLLLGRHVFATVEVSARWRSVGDTPPRIGR